MSIWIFDGNLPDYLELDDPDWKKNATRLLGPIEPDRANELADNLEKLFKQLKLDYLRVEMPDN